MAYDETLAARIRELTAGEPGLTERTLFGGLAFLIGGNMAVAASGQGGILVRVDPQESDALVEQTNAEHMVMRGKPMRGWLSSPGAPSRHGRARAMGRARHDTCALAAGEAIATTKPVLPA